MFNPPSRVVGYHCFNLMQLAILLGWMDERTCKDGEAGPWETII